MISKTLKNNAEVFSMLFFILGVHKNVIDENHDEFVKLRHKYRINEVHEIGWGICEPEGHDQELV